MTINSRNKGAAGEREVIHLVQTIMDEVAEEASQAYKCSFQFPRLIRNTLQSAQGGEDIHGLPWYAIEVKRCEKLDVGRWWLQTTRQAAAHNANDYVTTLRLELSSAAMVSSDAVLRQAGGVSFGGRPVERVVSLLGEVARPQRVPVLVYRQSQQPWRVVIWGSLATLDGKAIRCPVDIAWVAFALWLRIDLRVRLKAELDRLFPGQ